MSRRFELNPKANTQHLIAHTGAGHGSTNTAIRRFTTTQINVGNVVTFVDSSTDGSSFTINKRGIYSVIFVNGVNASGVYGISKNSNQLTTSVASITVAHLLAIAPYVANYFGCAAFVGPLEKGDVIRGHTDTGGNDTTDRVSMKITRIL